MGPSTQQLGPAHVKREALTDATEELDVPRAQHLAGSDLGGEDKGSSIAYLPLNKRKPSAAAPPFWVSGRFFRLGSKRCVPRCRLAVEELSVRCQLF